jgi:hypothetical protein
LIVFLHSSGPDPAELAAAVTSESISLVLSDEAHKDVRPQPILVLGLPGSGKSTVCAETLSLFGCAPGIINSMWDATVRIIVRIRLSAEESDRFLDDGEPLRVRRIFSTAVGIDVSRVTLATHVGAAPHRHVGFEIHIKPDYESPISAAEAADIMCRELSNEESDLNVTLSALISGEVVIESRFPPERFVDGLKQLPNGNFGGSVRSPGLEEFAVLFEGKPYRFIDVCGQPKSQFKRWVRMFSEVAAVLIVCDISQYDQPNKIADALQFVSSICNTGSFAPQRDARGYKRHIPIHLLLNKVDLFRDMLPSAPLAASCTAFKSFKGSMSFHDASAFVKSVFESQLDRARNDHTELHSHFTDASDSVSMKSAITAVLTQVRQSGFRPV